MVDSGGGRIEPCQRVQQASNETFSPSKKQQFLVYSCLNYNVDLKHPQNGGPRLCIPACHMVLGALGRRRDATDVETAAPFIEPPFKLCDKVAGSCWNL